MLVHELMDIPVDPRVINNQLDLPKHPAVVLSTEYSPDICIVVMVTFKKELEKIKLTCSQSSTQKHYKQEILKDIFPFKHNATDHLSDTLQLEGRQQNRPHATWTNASLALQGYVKPDCMFAVHRSMLCLWIEGPNMRFRLTQQAQGLLTSQLNKYYADHRLGCARHMMTKAFERMQIPLLSFLYKLVDARFLHFIRKACYEARNYFNNMKPLEQGFQQLIRASNASTAPDGSGLTIPEPQLITEALRYALVGRTTSADGQRSALYKLLYMQYMRKEPHTRRFRSNSQCTDLVSILLSGFVLGHAMGLAAGVSLREDAKGKLREAEEKCKLLNIEIGALITCNAKLRKRNADLKKLNTDLQGDVNDLESDITDLESKITTLRTNNTILQAEIRVWEWWYSPETECEGSEC